jgi:hypothetical protein
MIPPGRRIIAGVTLGFSLILFPGALTAAPKIEVDSANFDIGDIHEGNVDVVKHAFRIKNTGTDTLKIEKVKPG